jgi:Cu/Ag efflux pump CusA
VALVIFGGLLRSTLLSLLFLPALYAAIGVNERAVAGA